MKKFVFRRPDNWHAHLRRRELLWAVCHHLDIYGRVFVYGQY